MNTITNTTTSATTITSGFATRIESPVELRATFELAPMEFGKTVKHQLLAARTKGQVWDDSLGLRALHKASFAYWRARSLEMFQALCVQALPARSRHEFVAVFAAGMPAMKAEYAEFVRKQGALFAALGANSDLSSFLTLGVRTPEGGMTFKGFTSKELVQYLCGAGEYAGAAFGQDEAKAIADLHKVRVDMAGLRELFGSHPVGVDTWTRVLEGLFTKPRRRLLMAQDTVWTRTEVSAWQDAVLALPEKDRRPVKNSDVHHLLGALLKQLDFLVELHLRTLDRDIESKLREWESLHAGSSEGRADWEMGRDDFLDVHHAGMVELQTQRDDLEAFALHAIATLEATNTPFEAVHGTLAWLHIKKGDTFIKVTSQAEARVIRKLSWDQKVLERQVVEWDKLSGERLEAIDAALRTPWLDADDADTTGKN